jgi:hypothetical protein
VGALGLLKGCVVWWEIQGRSSSDKPYRFLKALSILFTGSNCQYFSLTKERRAVVKIGSVTSLLQGWFLGGLSCISMKLMGLGHCALPAMPSRASWSQSVLGPLTVTSS